jgi:hypothetical protein
MRINLLCYEPAGGWILFDYAEKLANSLQAHVDEVSLSSTQLAGYDVTLHINYWGLRQILVPGLHCTMVTHIDTAEKFALVKAQAEAGVWGYCVSEETTRRLNTLTGIGRFCGFSPPAMIEAEPKRIRIMIAGRLYVDNRKNESWAIDFFKQFLPESLTVCIMGAGWDGPVGELLGLGYSVEWHEAFMQDSYRELLKTADYLLVTGFDEGALSTLDAILYGVTPIVTAQGYHLEQNAPMFTFSNHQQLMQIAQNLKKSISEVNLLRKSMTDWDGFAKKHCAHWQAVLSSAQNQ